MTLTEKSLWDLEDVLKDLHRIQTVEEQAVMASRRCGATWADIARVYNVSRQAAHARWAWKESCNE